MGLRGPALGKAGSLFFLNSKLAENESKDRMRRIRANADKNVKGGGDFKPTAVYDMASYMRMEQQHGKGIMSDPTFRREYLRDNPECKLD